jgi:hypothetical protein
MAFPLPKWVTDLPEGRDRERAKDRFFIQLASVYASPKCNIRTLSDLIRVNYQTLKSNISNCKNQFVPFETFERIEQLLNADFFPHRED